MESGLESPAASLPLVACEYGTVCFPVWGTVLFPLHLEPARNGQQHDTDQNKRVNPKAMELDSNTTVPQNDRCRLRSQQLPQPHLHRLLSFGFPAL
jgi:hypothetical protein